MTYKGCKLCGKSIEAHHLNRNPKDGIKCQSSGSRAIGFDGDDVVALWASLGQPLTQLQAQAWQKATL